MKVFTCDCFQGYWPVESVAVIVAENAEAATVLLRHELAEKSLLSETADLGTTQYANYRFVTADKMVEVDLAKPSCILLNHGNY